MSNSRGSDDVFQETTIVLWRKFGEFEPGTGAAGGTIQSFQYDDAWYPETDNQGFTLVVVSTDRNYDDAPNWRSSSKLGGSPGAEDPESLAADFNGDALADRRDAVVLLTGYAQTSTASRITGDADGDRATTLRDIAFLQSVHTQPIVAPSPQAAEATLAQVAVDAVFQSSRDSSAQPLTARRRSPPAVDSQPRLKALPAEPIPSLSGDRFVRPHSRLTATRARWADSIFAETQLPGLEHFSQMVAEHASALRLREKRRT